MNTLPKSKTLQIDPLTHIFKNTSATYKFYWFMGILDLYVKRGITRMNIWDIMVEMTANAWYPVSYFRLTTRCYHFASGSTQLANEHQP